MSLDVGHGISRGLPNGKRTEHFQLNKYPRMLCAKFRLWRWTRKWKCKDFTDRQLDRRTYDKQLTMRKAHLRCSRRWRGNKEGLFRFFINHFWYIIQFPIHQPPRKKMIMLHVFYSEKIINYFVHIEFGIRIYLQFIVDFFLNPQR